MHLGRTVELVLEVIFLFSVEIVIKEESTGVHPGSVEVLVAAQRYHEQTLGFPLSHIEAVLFLVVITNEI